MSLHRTIFLSVVLTTFVGTWAAGDSPAGSLQRRSPIVQAVEKARGAVVNLHSERTAKGPAVEDNLNNAARSNGMGTGIIIDPRGYVVTNYHVVEDVTMLRARLSDGNTYNAKIVARDKDWDLALVKIDAEHSLPTIDVGTSSDLMIGETVIAIGNAYGYEHTVTVGVISALNRDVTLNKEISYKALIQTDASINPGNSGGPLLNVDGQLIGVNVAIRAGAQGIGFAIPADQMIRVMTDMLARRRRTEVWPGLTCKNVINLDKTPPWSLEVCQVDANSPAAKAGIKMGDVLVRAGDVDTFNTLDLERALMEIKAGENLALKVKRGGDVEQVALALPNTKTALSTTDLVWRQLGIHLTLASLEAVKQGGTHLRGGLLITEVNPNSPAAKAGLQRGDILYGLHQWETLSLENVQYVLQHQDVSTFYPLKYHVLRGGQTLIGWFQNVE